jgi:hypothetical protein
MPCHQPDGIKCKGIDGTVWSRRIRHRTDLYVEVATHHFTDDSADTSSLRPWAMQPPVQVLQHPLPATCHHATVEGPPLTSASNRQRHGPRQAAPGCSLLCACRERVTYDLTVKQHKVQRLPLSDAAKMSIASFRDASQRLHIFQQIKPMSMVVCSMLR